MKRALLVVGGGPERLSFRVVDGNASARTVLLHGTKMSKPEYRTRIANYWRDRVEQLKREDAFQDLREVARYRDRIGEILKTLADMNMLEAGDRGFKPLVEELEKRIAG